ncbi:zinc finger matrin-type protein 3 isoform X1 [Esox lucius]|uniref:Zinc finger matrin-type protein 3 n=2 Tax=Esox lucius TaxID=8010 RepID=A0AAY5KMX6_ESOLU|nr:zinc finger matrin-type protein 3 isoform X1 [Esox lucius]
MMALHVKNRDAYYQSADYYRNLQPLNYGESSHYFARLPGPESMLKPSLRLFGQQQPLFQPMPTHPLGPPPPTLGPPPPVVVGPDPLHFPISSTLSTKPPAHLQLIQGPPCPVPCPVPAPTAQAALSSKPQEEEAEMGATDQDATLEELCKPLYCKLCNVTLNSAQQAQAHYQGKNHSKKLRNFYAGSQQPPAITIPEVIEPGSQLLLPTPLTDSATSKQPVSFKGASRVILATENDYCKLCDASFSSPAVAQAHYQGKNHAKRLRLAEAQQSSIILESAECVQRRPRKEGSEYRLIKNRRSPQLPLALPGPYYNPRPRQRIPRDLAMCVTPSGQFYCSMCNSGASEEADFRLHLESKQHKSKVSEQRYRSEMENLGYT